jgi:PAS domain S-box-containing protein
MLSEDSKKRRRAEDVLIESEGFAWKVLNASLNGIYIYDVKLGQNVFINKQYTTITGYTFDELKTLNGLQFFEFFHPDDRQRVAGHMEKLARSGGETLEIEYRFKTRDQRWIWCLSRDSVFARNRDGSASQIIGTFLDITDRKRAERALKESDKLYRTIGETIPYGVWVADAGGYCTYVSPSFLEMVGMTMDQIQQFGWLHLLPPEDVGPTKKHWLHCVLTGEDFEHEHRLKSIDGFYRSVLAIGRPVRDEEGKIIKWVGLNLDITDRKRMENDLRESRAKLETALASMTDAVFISDAQGRLINSNDAFATFHRFRSKDECSKTLAEYPDFLDVFMADGEPVPLDQLAVHRALRGETVMNAEYFLRRKDTRETWVGSYSFGPIRDQDGVIVGSVVVGRDITDRKKSEEELRRLSHFPEENPNPVLRCTLDGVTLYANTSAQNWVATFGRQADRVLPEPVRVAMAKARGQNHAIETEITDPTGRTLSIFAVQPPGEDYVNLYGIDFTDRKRAEEALKRSNEELEQFACGFARPSGAVARGCRVPSAPSEPMRRPDR